MDTAKIAAGAATGLLGIMGFAAAGSSDLFSSTETVAVVPDTIAENQYQGPCSVVTPPEPDPCEAVQGQIRYSMLGHLVNAVPYKNWRKGAPLDAARLDALMVNPQCSTPTNPQPQTLQTFMGAAIGAAIQAYACAKGTGPLTWPAPNPPPLPGSTDKTPPTPPSGLQITPNP